MPRGIPNHTRICLDCEREFMPVLNKIFVCDTCLQAGKPNRLPRDKTNRTCNKCKESLPLSEFYSSKGRGNIGFAYRSLNGFCRGCSKENTKAVWRKDVKASRELSRERYQKNRDKILARCREKYPERREAILKRKKRYRQSEHGRKVIYENNKRRRDTVGQRWRKMVNVRKMYEDQNGLCALSGLPLFPDPTDSRNVVDHIYPAKRAKAEGWTKERINHPDNLQLVHARFNGMKHAKLTEEFEVVKGTEAWEEALSDVRETLQAEGLY